MEALEDKSLPIRGRLSEKGKHSWTLKNKLDIIARNLCFTYYISYCCDETCWYMNFKHLPFQCSCNTNKIISSYALGNYDFYDVEKNYFYDVEQIEEFIAWMGAIEIFFA